MKILITGASGMVGQYIWRYFPKGDYEWFGLHCSKPLRKGPGMHPIQVDMTDKRALERTLLFIQPDIIWHLAAASNTNFCEQFPEDSSKINVQATQQIVEYCKKFHAFLVFASSAQLFDGLKTNYSVSSKPSPKNMYGQQKMEAEVCILESGIEAAILRIALVVGFAYAETYNFLSDWVHKWRLNQPIQAFDDEFRSVCDPKMIAEASWSLSQSRQSGIFNVGLASCVSRFELAQMAAEMGGFSKSLVIQSKQCDFPMAAYRPPQLCFKREDTLFGDSEELEHILQRFYAKFR